jgi:hypothetical protein
LVLKDHALIQGARVRELREADDRTLLLDRPPKPKTKPNARLAGELCATDPLFAHDRIALSKGDQMWRPNIGRAGLRLRHAGRAWVRGLTGNDLRTSRGKQGDEDD